MNMLNADLTELKKYQSKNRNRIDSSLQNKGNRLRIGNLSVTGNDISCDLIRSIDAKSVFPDQISIGFQYSQFIFAVDFQR